MKSESEMLILCCRNASMHECQQVLRKSVTKLWSRGQPSTSQLLRLPFLVAIAKASVKRIVIFSMKSI